MTGLASLPSILYFKNEDRYMLAYFGPTHIIYVFYLDMLTKFGDDQYLMTINRPTTYDEFRSKVIIGIGDIVAYDFKPHFLKGHAVVFLVQGGITFQDYVMRNRLHELRGTQLDPLTELILKRKIPTTTRTNRSRAEYFIKALEYSEDDIQLISSKFPVRATNQKPTMTHKVAAAMVSKKNLAFLHSSGGSDDWADSDGDSANEISDPENPDPPPVQDLVDPVDSRVPELVGETDRVHFMV